VTRRRGIRRKQVFGNLKDGKGYCKLTEETLDRTVWRTGFERDCEPVVRQTEGWVNVRVCPAKYIYL
jgi:hypothetical protein